MSRHVDRQSWISTVIVLRRLAVALAVLSVPGVAHAQGMRYEKIHEGKHWIWYARQDQFRRHKADIAALYDYADKAFDKLCESWGLKLPNDRYTLLVMAHTGGGFAAGDISEVRSITGKESPGIGCAYDAFSGSAHGIKAYWAHILITHEMVNLFTGQVVSGGWPVDWWANHRSPFPLMTAVEIEYALVPQMAVFHEREGREDPLVGMFLHLKDQFGWAMFRKAFQRRSMTGSDGTHSAPIRRALRTAYVAAYLQIGAPEDISGILTPLVPGYDAQAVADIVKARSRWSAMPEGSAQRRAQVRLPQRGLQGRAEMIGAWGWARTE